MLFKPPVKFNEVCVAGGLSPIEFNNLCTPARQLSLRTLLLHLHSWS